MNVDKSAFASKIHELLKDNEKAQTLVNDMHSCADAGIVSNTLGIFQNVK